MPPSNRTLVLNLLAIVAGMLMLTAASVPLYRLFCQVTGYGGTTERATQAPARTLDHVLTIRFNADTGPALPWEFRPGENAIQVKIGQQATTHFVAYNRSDRAITGRAVYNVVPFEAGTYFVKIQCFCFNEQTLQPHQRVNMPVLFYVDPSIVKDAELQNLKTITLSYTFFEVKK